jgi:ATP-dependent Lhr-like helicase
LEFLKKYLYCGDKVANAVYTYFEEQAAFSRIPDISNILVEKFKEEKEILLFHCSYGRRVNDALARAYAYAAGRLRHRDIEIGVSDSGFFIAGESLDEKRIINAVTSKNLKQIAKEAIEKTDVLKRRFRHCASRSLMILRNYKGREKSVGKQQVHSEFLLTAVRKISNEFPILQEARREVLEDLMDIKNAVKTLEWIESKKVSIGTVRTPIVSPFGLNLFMQGRNDIIKLEDRTAFIKRMHQLHMKVIEEKKNG